MFSYFFPIGQKNDFFDEEIVKKIFKNLKEVPKKQNGIISINFIDKETIQNLNFQHRQKNSPTDILSFHYFDIFEKNLSEEIVADIVICEEVLEEGGEKYGLGKEYEFYKLLIHGLVHILGYDHETQEEFIEMEENEKKVWEKTFEKQIYPSSERFV